MGGGGESGRGGLVYGAEASVCERETHGAEAGEVAPIIAPFLRKFELYRSHVGSLLLRQQQQRERERVSFTCQLSAVGDVDGAELDDTT